MDSLSELERHWAVMKHYHNMPFGLTTINPAVIKGGRRASFIPDECELECVIHYMPSESHDEIKNELDKYIRRVAAADLWLQKYPPRLNWGRRIGKKPSMPLFPPASLPINNRALRCLAKAHKSVTGQLPIISIWPSVCDAGWLCDRGIPAVIYGPGGLKQAHAVNEFVTKDELVSGTKVIALFLADWGS